MSFDYKVVLDIATLVVIAASCVAAVRQLSVFHSANQLNAVLTIQHDFREHDLQDAFLDVQADLARRLADPVYRETLQHRGYIDSRAHPELVICNWFEGVGVMVKYKIIAEDAFMDLYGRLVVYYWDLTAPAIAIMRRTRGRTQYHNFEYLAVRARAWIGKYPEGLFPRTHLRPDVADAWDGATPAEATL